MQTLPGSPGQLKAKSIVREDEEVLNLEGNAAGMKGWPGRRGKVLRFYEKMT